MKVYKSQIMRLIAKNAVKARKFKLCKFKIYTQRQY